MNMRHNADADLAVRIAHKDEAAFEAFESLMRKHNGRLFRIARAILKDDAEAEDALQDAYLDAYRKIEGFRGGSQLATWLTRIVINQALGRLRRQKRERVVVPFGRRRHERPNDQSVELRDDKSESPTNAALRAEVRRMLERRIDELPVAFRAVFVMREVEDMTVQETAECLSIPEATVRTRLLRARALLREALARDLDTATTDIFPFAGQRCDRIVAAVLRRISGPAN